MPFLKMCDSKNSILTKEQQTSGLLSNLGLEAPLNKRYKTNKVVNKYLLAGGAIKRGIITNQPFLYSAHTAELSDPTRKLTQELNKDVIRKCEKWKVY